MLRNYLLTAFKVLQRRKFFTFVNLFAVALTLAVLTVVITLIENFVRPMGAESRSDHYVAIDWARVSSADGNSSWDSRLGYRMLERHVLPLASPDAIGFFSGPSQATVFADGRKLTPDLARTDAGYWSILDFTFVEGRPISESDVAEGRFVAVINRGISETIFGGEPAVGRALSASGQRFEVIGVVENEPEIRRHAYAEIWVPVTTAPSTAYQAEWVGDFTALLYAEDDSALPEIQRELLASLDDFVHDDPDRYQVASAPANTNLERLARTFLDNNYGRDSKVGTFILVLVAAFVAFMLLPAINLINLNVSRILERASEIGVRKAFGASARNLVGQFLVENLVLSAIGGVAGFLLGLVLLDLVEGSGLIAYADFRIDWRVFLASLLATTAFGLISGVYPAWKMARFNPVRALRGG